MSSRDKPLTLLVLSWGALLAAGMSLSAKAGDYEPTPTGWDIRIDLPGVLSVGAEYCTALGKCQTVGDNIVGFSVGGTAVGGVQGCQMMPESEPCIKAEIHVQVLAATHYGSAIVRLNGRNYAVGGLQWHKQEPDGSYIGGPVSVLYQGASIPIMIYEQSVRKAARPSASRQPSR